MRHSSLRMLSGLAALGLLIWVALSSPGQDAPRKAEDEKKQEDRLAQLEARLAQMEKHLVEVLKAVKDTQAKDKEKSNRYQMLNAGKNVVILDHSNGTTRIIEGSEQRFQSVTLGKTLFIVDLVGGRVAETREGSK